MTDTKSTKAPSQSDRPQRQTAPVTTMAFVVQLLRVVKERCRQESLSPQQTETNGDDKEGSITVSDCTQAEHPALEEVT